MKVRVELSICDKHGQCVSAAPQVFWFDDDGELAYRRNVAEDELAAAEEAELLCPVHAITLER